VTVTTGGRVRVVVVGVAVVLDLVLPVWVLPVWVLPVWVLPALVCFVVVRDVAFAVARVPPVACVLASEVVVGAVGPDDGSAVVLPTADVSAAAAAAVACCATQPVPRAPTPAARAIPVVMLATVR
jgi:hypothetical protein